MLSIRRGTGVDTMRLARVALLVLVSSAAACRESETPRPAAPPAVVSEAPRRAGGVPPGETPGSVRTFVIAPAASKASYIADEELFALALSKFGLSPGWAKVVGSTQQIEGRFQIDTQRPGAWLGQNEFTVRLDTLTTGREMRDNWIRDNGPRFGQYPAARFTANAIEGSDAAPRHGDEMLFTLRGPLTIREISRPVAFAVKARLADDTLRGSATTRLRMSDFGIETITFYDTLTVADEVGLDISLVARPDPTSR